MSEFLTDLKRTHDCGSLRAADVGKRVVLFGWVASRRDHGGCVFVDLRDRGGFTQIVFEPSVNQEAHTLAGELRSEFCIGVTGVVVDRGAGRNPKMPTGEIEVHCDRLTIFSRSETPPFDIEDDTAANETLRLKHRSLDLRRPSLQRNFLVRSAIYQTTRRVLTEQGFLEIETPFMVKYTPGGARNFLVPSRLNPGHVLRAGRVAPDLQAAVHGGGLRPLLPDRALLPRRGPAPRSPARVHPDRPRDELRGRGGRADGGRAADGRRSGRTSWGSSSPTPFARMSYAEAIGLYGSDKPDLRFGLPLCDLTEVVRRHDGGGVEMFRAALASGRGDGVVKGWRLPAAARQPPGPQRRRQAGGLRQGLRRPRPAARPHRRRRGLDPVAAQDHERRLPPRHQRRRRPAGGRPALPAVRRRASWPTPCWAALRLHLAQTPRASSPRSRGIEAWKFCWITEFPLFEESEDGKLVAAHHPFTSPLPEDLARLESEPASVRARAYDLVLNGNEMAGGSIRIHSADVQARVFAAIGLSAEDARAKFGFLLDAFKYGPPPHGGIAAGVDRLAMLLCGAESLRDVIAFPKTQKGTDLCTEAPSSVAQRQLDELHIALKL